jgi:FAD/FMN-containing dehydrogenase
MASFEEQLTGKLLWRGCEGYEAARRGTVWRLNTPKRYPEAVVTPETDQDIVAAVRLARTMGLQVSVKSGGHSWTSPHLRDGCVVIDLARMQDFRIDAHRRRVFTRPAVKGRRLNDALLPHGLMVPTGHHNTVGCGGFLMCGGFGWNFRQFGNGCRNVMSIDVVTADGELIHCDERENTDFYWAARGGGAGFFGIVTRFEIQAHPRPAHLTQNGYVFPIDYLDEALAWVHQLGPKSPEYLELVAPASSYAPDGSRSPTRVVVSGLAFAKTEDEARAAKALFDTCPIKHKATMRRDCVPTTIEERCDMATLADPEGNRYAADNMYTDASYAEISPYMHDLFGAMPTPRTHVFWLYQGERPNFDGMALSAWGETFIAAYTIWQDEAEDEAMNRWPSEAMRKLEPIGNGEGQMNDENMHARRPVRYLSPDSAARLEALRGKHDPHNVFLSFLT